MYALVIYCLKAGACLAVFYLCFKWLLSRETFHRFNRCVVLGAMVLSFSLPLCVITVYRELPATAAISAVAGEPAGAGAVASDMLFSRLEAVVVILFLAGTLATLAATLWSLLGVWRIIRRGRRERLDDGTIVVYVQQPVTPFSWGRYIVLSECDRAEGGDVILTHERAHLRLHHSWDLLLTDVAGCLQWFNPAMWLLRRELRAIHEYEADEAVLASGADAKALVVLPLTALALGAFAQTSYRVAPPADPAVVIPVSEPALDLVCVASDRVGELSDSVRVTIRNRGVEDKNILWIIDGREATPEEKEALNPDQIGSISVLKDASVTQKYPGRDVDGVIEVNTKKFEAQRALEEAGQEPKTSPSAANKPAENRSLIYIDGRRANWDEVSRIAPERIESIVVLKGESAVETYGLDAAEGAVVVKTQMSPASDKEPPATTAVYHKVRQGDTVHSVAKRYGMSVNRLCGMNNLKHTKPLQIGRTLRVK